MTESRRSLPEFLPYGRQEVTENDISAVVDALRSPFLTQGPRVEDFEAQLARYCGAKYAVATNSGTAALHIAYLAAGLQKEERVLTSAITFAATSNAALYCGARADFADIENSTFNVSTKTLNERITSQTRIVVPVHMAGRPCDLRSIQKQIKDFSQRQGKRIYLVEDASHALGAGDQSGKIGNCAHSDMCVFSFHPVKSITAGEGGAVTTNDPQLYEKLCILRSHGIIKDPQRLSQNPGPWFHEQVELGFNYRITDFQCALAGSQLKRLDQFIRQRQTIADAYGGLLSGIAGVTLPERTVLGESAWHLYVIRVDWSRFGTTRAQSMRGLAELGIGSQVHYIPVYRHPYYQAIAKVDFHCYPVAEKYYEECLSIPIFQTMSISDAERVAMALKQVLSVAN